MICRYLTCTKVDSQLFIHSFIHSFINRARWGLATVTILSCEFCSSLCRLPCSSVVIVSSIPPSTTRPLSSRLPLTSFDLHNTLQHSHCKLSLSSPHLETVFPQFPQPVADTGWGYWLSSLRSAKNNNKIWRTWFSLLRSSRLEYSSIRPARHYWYQYIQKTTQECTFWSCL